MANNKIQIKRTSVSGRTPNTTNSSNSQYIAAGELALNLADNKLYTSNGSALIDLTAGGGGGGGSANITISDTAPSTPSAGQLWYYSGDGTLYVYYNDGNSSQWVSTAGGGGINEANNTNYLGGYSAASYARLDSSPSFTGNVAIGNNLTVNTTLTVNGVSTFTNTTSNNLTVTNNLTPSKTITANGSTGTAGQILTSSGSSSNVYWSNPVTTGKAIAMAIVFGG